VAFVLAALGAVVAVPAHGLWTGFGVALAVAVLVGEREDRLSAECALKLAWVLAPALALSWVGLYLLTLATGSARPLEQWSVLALGLDAPTLWRVAVPLALLAGVVMLGSAPFHFWVADLLQGARVGVAPLAVVALQALGFTWLQARFEGIEAFPAARTLTSGLLGFAALVAFLAGAATLVAQRRPERRVGTLASLHAGLALAALAAGRGMPEVEGFAAVWAAHLALALAGAGAVARFIPASEGLAPAAALFRHHPISGAAGLFSLLSLAGVPGTPGARLWLEVGRALVADRDTPLLVALGVAWVAAFAVTLREARAAAGLPATTTPPAGAVPAVTRAALLIAALGLVFFGLQWGWRAG
jgi:NADH-quinone oxidoreductase subunit N